jgi:hypothetical protein
VNLWTRSWHQVPAGSLPDDDNLHRAKSCLNLHCSLRTATIAMRRSRASHSTINSHRVSPSLQRRPPAAQIPIAEHAARRGPPNAPKSRFRPLAVFVRRPPAFVARFEAAGIRKPSQKHALPRRSIAVRFTAISRPR